MQRLWRFVLPTLFLITLTGCPQPTDSGGGGGDTSGDGGSGGTGGATTGTVQGALSFAGSVSGDASTVSSTSGSTQGSSARKFAGRALAVGATGWFETLDGKRLLNAEGNEYPEFPVSPSGAFGPIAGLPVGVDLVLCIDENNDDTPELQTIIQIPSTNGTSGALDNVECDPITTLAFARVRKLLAELGVSGGDLDTSVAALIQQIQDAFERLFEESGIDQQITLDQLKNLTEDALAALFDTLVPETARRTMDVFRGNLALTQATSVDAAVKAVAEMLLRGGFAIADQPGGIDLSFLGSFPRVRSFSFADFREAQADDEGADGPPGPGDMAPGGGPSPAQGVPGGPTIYFSPAGGFNRNFGEQEDRNDGPHGPIFSEFVLSELAQLYLDGKTLSLESLHKIVVSLENGMGARYSVWLPQGPGEPPAQYFETPDGKGTVIDLGALFEEISELSLNNPDPEAFEDVEATLRDILREALAETSEPEFERLFDGILTNRIASFEAYAQSIRDRRAHLPFSRSGPAKIFVLADGDRFGESEPEAVTVDILFDADGNVVEVAHNPSGTGRFYISLGWTEEDGGMTVHFISRQTGRALLNHRGEFQEAEITDETVFEDVGAETFAEFVSDVITGYPGAPALRIPNPEFDPTRAPDAETNAPNFEAFVLVDQPGPDANPIRVAVEETDPPTVTVSESGEYYLFFTEQSQEEGLFALISAGGQFYDNDPDAEGNFLVDVDSIIGLDLSASTFTHYFGIDVPNPGYDPTGAPYYDDINGNGVEDAGEPRFDFRAFLHDPSDWRSTAIEQYYRRADNGGPVAIEDVDWSSDTPQLQDGTDLVARTLRPRLNAFRFGNPNVTLLLLSAFAPPELFNGTQGLTGATRMNPFMALALLNLVFDGIQNIEMDVDWDGPTGPAPEHVEVLNADLFTVPIGDPLQLIVDGFIELAE